MKTTVEASLLPILRSRGQAEILCAVLANPNREWTLGELAKVSGQSLPTVQREVERAELAALVESRRMGRQRLVKAGPSQIAIMLANLLLWSYGPKFVIAEEFAGIKGIDRLFIFGSWAARYHGVDGYPPQDLDVLVIGMPTSPMYFELHTPHQTNCNLRSIPSFSRTHGGRTRREADFEWKLNAAQ
jgi:hypothetical protein